MRREIWIPAIVVLPVLFPGCASTSRDSRGDATAPHQAATDANAPAIARPVGVADAAATPTQEEDMPFTISEAGLPRGYPAPGPIGKVIVKDYPPYRAAFARARNDEGENARQNAMFGTLFQHIKRNKIAMTAPVEMTYEPIAGEPSTPANGARDTGAPKPVSMAFLYGEPEWGKAGDDGAVRVMDVPAMTVLSVGVRGSYTGKNYADAMGMIRKYLDEHPGEFAIDGPPRMLGYNSPFVPWFLRYSEVQLPVRRISGK